MIKAKPTRRSTPPPLQTGQIWRAGDLRLQLGLIGKYLVHYKLAKANAVRVPNRVGSRSTIEAYLKKNKAVLMRKKAAR